MISLLTGWALVCNAEQGVTIKKSTGDETVFEIIMPAVQFAALEETNLQTLSAEGFGTIRDSGKPGVPAKSVLLEIPPECDVEIKTVAEQRTTIHDFLLAPAPKAVMQEDAQGEIKLVETFEMDQAAYAQNIFYPRKFAELEYTGYLRDKKVARISVFPVQYNPALRELHIYKKLIIAVHYTSADGQQNDFMVRQETRNFNTPDQQSVFEKIYAGCLLNYTPGLQYSSVLTSPAVTAERRASLSGGITQSPFAVKAVIAADGIYKITYEELNALGIDLTDATNENLHMENQGQEIAIFCSGEGKFGPGDYIIFYGQAFKSLYCRTNVYWLYQTSQPGERMTQIDGTVTGSETDQSYFSTTVHVEKDLLYWSNIPPYEEGVDHWYWEKFSIIVPPLAKDFNVTLGSLEKNAGTYAMKISLQGQTNTGKNPDHHTKIYINNNLVDDFTWDGQVGLTRDISGISPAFFISSDNNTVTVEAVADTGVSVDSYYMNWFEITCAKKYAAESNALSFHNNTTGTVSFSLQGFNESDLLCLDVTDPFNVGMVVNAAVSSQGTSYTMRFRDAAQEVKTYYACGMQAVLTPEKLIVDQSSDLSTYRSNIDYIIITHEDFYDAIQELKTYRESKGLHVAVAKIQDIYDEFSYGIKDAQAIKDFLAYAYTNWNSSGHPQYVLLVGDSSLDYRDDLGLYAQGQLDYIPTFIYQTNEFGNTPTDNWFVCINGSDYLPDMTIGRICVRNNEDLQNIIAKIKKYESDTVAAWCGNVILAADNESIFESISDSLAAMLPEGFQAKKVYLDDYDKITEATSDLILDINAGALLTNYAGHGNIDEWAAEYLFHTNDQRKNSTRDDLARLSNGDRLTFVMALNCLNGYFPNWADDYSLAEDFLRVDNKGAIACFAPTALGYPSEHQVLARKIFTGLFNDNNTIAGSLVTTAKIGTYSQISSRDILETFTLFGDPATELKLVPGSEFTAFKTIDPADNETLPPLPLPTFIWGGGLYERFKIQFSPEPSFSAETTITAPLFPLRFITTESYTPNIFIWAFVHILGAQNSAMYWRVVAYDENFNQIATTEPQSFILQR